MTNADAIDWGAAPIAAVTGVVRLRNGEVVPVRCDGYGCREATGHKDYAARSWRDGSAAQSPGLSRHQHDIVAQLSVGPTEPGVYETHAGPITVVRQGDAWESGPGVETFDEFGRSTVRVYGSPLGYRSPRRDLLRRVGDVQPPTCRHAPPQEYTAEEGAAAMNALCPPHDPGAFDREDEAEGNSALIAEAFTVRHETGLTPRQLAEQHHAAVVALGDALLEYSKEKSELLAILEEVASLIPVAVQRVLVSHALAKASKTGGTTTPLPCSPKS